MSAANSNVIGVNDNDTPCALPDEDRLELPPAWKRHVLPRRGRPGPEIALDAGDQRLFIQRYDQLLRKALTQTENATYTESGLDYLEGEPDPFGAAAVRVIMQFSKFAEHFTGLRPCVDLWIAEGGLPFAMRAAVEALVVSGWPGGTGPGRSRMETCVLHENDLSSLPAVVGRGPEDRDDLRSLIAAATDEEYAAVVAALEGHRTTPARRYLVTFLLPDETDWADEVFAEYQQHRGWGNGDLFLWQSVSDVAQLRAADITVIEPYFVSAEAAAALLDALGTAALPVFAGSLDRVAGHSAEGRKLLLNAIAHMPSDDAAAYLFGNFDKPHTLPAAISFAERFPVRALRTIADLAEQADAGRRAKLAGIAAADPDRLAAATACLDEDRRARIEALFDEVSISTAPLDSLPPLLAAPPWTVKRRKQKPVVIEGLEPSAGIELDWADGERERWNALLHEYMPDETDRSYWKRVLFQYRREAADHWNAVAFAFGPRDMVEEGFTTWSGEHHYPDLPTWQRLLARYGEGAVDKAIAIAGKHAALFEVLLPVRSVETARLTADRLVRLKSVRAAAIAWLDRHGVEGAALLVPDALGADKKARRNAEAALSLVASRQGADTVLAAAERYGDAARDAIAALLDTDPLEPPQGVAIPKPAPWANASMLPQVLLKGRELALPSEAVEHLTTVLGIASPEFPYAGVDIVAEACDAASLREFSWALFEQWIAAGAPSKDSWAFTQLLHFADDDTVRRLTPMIREWPGQSQHKRAVTGLELLGAIGTEEALRAIHGIAQRVKFKALKAKAAEQIEAVAEGLGLTTEQLGDRLVPDFGLDEASALLLDYGPRRFRVGLDEQLRPFVSDEDGKPRKSLPKPGKSDDAERAEAAYKRFAQLKKDLRSVAKDQIGRLESAMISGRTWSVADFDRYFVRHPLVWHLARRLVWVAEADGAPTAFRIAEDRTLTDVDDEDFTLADDATIRVAHPALLDDVDSWSEVLADYEILQPFDQLARPVLTFTDDELKTGRLERFEGVTVEVGRILGMTKRGWRRATPEDAGVEPGIAYPLPGGGYAIAELDPGVWVGAISECPDQTLRQVYLSDSESYWYREERRSFPTDIDAVTASEVLGSLARLTGR
jgi:hypothetical protein